MGSNKPSIEVTSIFFKCHLLPPYPRCVFRLLLQESCCVIVFNLPFTHPKSGTQKAFKIKIQALKAVLVNSPDSKLTRGRLYQANKILGLYYKASLGDLK